MASYSPGGARGSWSFSGGAAGRAGAGQTLAQLAGWRAPHSFEVFATSPAVTSPVLPGYSSFDRDGFAESRGASPTAGPDMRASPLSPSPDSPRTAVGMGAASLLKDEPDVARNREKIMFLSLPCKNNGKAPEASSSGGVLSKLLPRKGKDNGQFKASGDVDFKSMLLPAILEAAAQPAAYPDGGRSSSPVVRKSASSPLGRSPGRSPSRSPSPFALARNAALRREVEDNSSEEEEDDDDFGLPPLPGRFKRARNPSTAGINSASRKTSYNAAFAPSPSSRGPSIPDESQWLALNQLRIHAGTPERSPRGVERILQYFAQLEYLEKKFPFESGHSKIHGNFRWFEAFGDHKIFASSAPIITDCIQYEKGATLYNLAALYSQLGCNARLWTAEGLKEAGNYFQKAAGVLTYIRNSLQPRFRIKLERSSDLSEASLTAAIQLCLAQAIECFYERANKDQTSKSLSKVAAQTSDLYEQALEVARSNQSKTWTRFPAEWLVVMRCKRLLFQSIALLHTENSLPDPVNTAVGERVCRLRVAVEVAEQARKETKALKSPWSAGLKILVQEYLELMLSSFMLAEAANMQNYHQTEPDRRLLAPPPRPKVSLVEAFDFKRDVFGDETRFVDLLEGVKAPQVWGDFNGFAQSAKQTAVWVKGELKRALDLVESRLGKLDIRLAGSIHSETSPILSTSALMSAAAAAQQVRQETDKVLQKLAQAQYEENVLPSNEAISKLAELGKWTAGNVEESAYILDNIDTSSFPQDPSVFTHVGNLRGALSRISSEAAGRVEALASLKEELSALDFEVLDWNEDRLRAVVPMLQKAKDFVKQHVKSFDRESCLQKAEEIRQQCDLKFQEMASIENEIDTVGPTTDLHIHLGYRRRQLQILEAEVARIAENAETLATKVDDVLQSIESVSNRVHEERESRQIVADFDTALSHYQSFRANVTAEVQRATELRKESVEVLLRCLKLPTKPKGGSGGDSFGGASFGRASGNVQKDPLLLSILQKESKSLGISPSSSFPRSSDKRSFGSPSNRRASDFRHEDFIAAMPEDDDEMLAFVSSRRAGSPATKPTLAKQGSQGEIMKRMLVKAEVMHPNQAAKVFSKPAPIVTSHVRLVEDALKQLAQAQAETQASIQKLASTDPTPSTGRTVQGEDYMFISKAHGDSPISGGPSPLTANSARKLQRTRSQLRQLREASERNLEQVHSQLERKASLLQRMASSASSISLPDVITESAGSAIKGGLKKLVDGARNIVQNAAQSAAQAAQAGREERQRRREEHVEQKREQLATDRTAFIEAYNTRGSNKDQGNPGDETESNYSRSSSSVPRRPIQPKEAYGLPRPEVPVARESGTKVEAAKTVLIPASALQQKLDKERTRLAQAPQLNQWIRSSNQRERSTSDVAAMGTSKIRIVSGATTSSQASRTDLTENTADRQLRLDTSSVAVNRQVAQLKSASPSRKASGAGFLESDISNSTLQNASGSNIWAQSPLAAHPSSPTGAITRVPVDRVSLVPGQPRISRSEPAPASSRHGSISQLAPTSKPSGLKNLVDEDNATSDEELEAELAKLVKEDIDAEPPTTSSLSDLKGKGKEPEFRREPSVNGVAEHENEKFGGLPDKWASIGRDAVQESDNESAEDLDRPATNTLPALNAFSFSAPPLSKSVGGHNVRFGLDLDDEIEGETEEQPAFPEDHSDSEKPMAHHAHASSGHKKKKKGRR